MTTSIECLEATDLENVQGGASQANSTAVQAGKKLAKGIAKGLPLANAGFAGYDAYQGYSNARQKGASFGGAMKEAGLEGLNSATWGASNYVLDRE